MSRNKWKYKIKKHYGAFYIQDANGFHVIDEYGDTFKCYSYEEAIDAVRVLEEYDNSEEFVVI